MLAKEVAADAGAVSGLQEEIHRLGPEVAQLHMGQGAMFKEWLAEEKAIAAEIEKRRKQQEADDVRLKFPPNPSTMLHGVDLEGRYP